MKRTHKQWLKVRYNHHQQQRESFQNPQKQHRLTQSVGIEIELRWTTNTNNPKALNYTVLSEMHVPCRQAMQKWRAKSIERDTFAGVQLMYSNLHILLYLKPRRNRLTLTDMPRRTFLSQFSVIHSRVQVKLAFEIPWENDTKQKTRDAEYDRRNIFCRGGLRNIPNALIDFRTHTHMARHGLRDHTDISISKMYCEFNNTNRKQLNKPNPKNHLRWNMAGGGTLSIIGLHTLVYILYGLHTHTLPTQTDEPDFVCTAISSRFRSPIIIRFYSVRLTRSIANTVAMANVYMDMMRTSDWASKHVWVKRTEQTKTQ